MIRGLVCDFGGVLTSPLVHGFLAYQDESGVSPRELGEAMARLAERDAEHPLFALERGEISEREFARRLEGELDGRLDFARLRRIYFERLEPNRQMIDYVRELRGRGMRTALCTNNVREWEPLWRAKLPELEELFEHLVDSAFVGTRKPEREIFDVTLARLGLPAEECVLVDDLDVNCEAARELGMSAVTFRDASQAIAELEALLPNFRPATP